MGTFSARQVTQTCKRGADLGPRPLAEVPLCREEMRVCIGVRRAGEERASSVGDEGRHSCWLPPDALVRAPGHHSAPARLERPS